ncbi:MAG: hypothetical protein QHG99_04975 [Methanomicrobiales archaeon]|nr:hypothetical protein [Methanomicrobiales archaeon]
MNPHIGLAEHLGEVLASGLEVPLSIHHNRLQVLNDRMAMLVACLAIIGTALPVPAPSRQCVHPDPSICR